MNTIIGAYNGLYSKDTSIVYKAVSCGISKSKLVFIFACDTMRGDVFQEDKVNTMY